MTPPARIALATPADRAEPTPAALAWLIGLMARGQRAQYFFSRACPIGTGVVGQVTGLPGRHLDAWLMPEAVLRAVFARGACQSELAIVEGTLEEPRGLWHPCGDQPGALRPIAEALDLPVVFLLPCPPAGLLHLPHIPEGVDAIFLDGVDGPEDFDRFSRFVRLATGKPVVGGLDRLPGVRETIRSTARRELVDEGLLNRLGASFLRYADLPAIQALGRSRPVTGPEVAPGPRCGTRFRVAYAMDEVFGAYFPDTLESLESLGAQLLDFSPLRDERLPDRVDLVMIGCGYPDAVADALAGNVSLVTELQSHALNGQRIYAEGGGTAYLGRSMVVEGRRVRGAGILPFDAELVTDPEPPTPVERRLERGCWLGPAGTHVRGYLSGRWRLSPLSEAAGRASSVVSEGDVYVSRQTVGGLIHLHLGALADVMTAFAAQGLPSVRS